MLALPLMPEGTRPPAVRRVLDRAISAAEIVTSTSRTAQPVFVMLTA